MKLSPILERDVGRNYAVRPRLIKWLSRKQSGGNKWILDVIRDKLLFLGKILKR